MASIYNFIYISEQGGKSVEKENKKIIKENIKLSHTSAGSKAIKISSKKISNENVKIKEVNSAKELTAATAEAILNTEIDVKMAVKQTEEVIRKVLMLEGVG